MYILVHKKIKRLVVDPCILVGVADILKMNQRACMTKSMISDGSKQHYNVLGESDI